MTLRTTQVPRRTTAEEDDGRGGRITDQAIEREIAEMRTLLENSTQAKDAVNGHFQGAPFHNIRSAERSAGVASHTDDWFDQEPNPRPYIPVKPDFLALKLELFDGDCTKWPEFSAIFKALIHDVVQTAYQRLVYLRIYFTTKIQLQDRRTANPA